MEIYYGHNKLKEMNWSKQIIMWKISAHSFGGTGLLSWKIQKLNVIK